MKSFQELRALVRARHGSIHRFAATSALPRATVYQALSGRYPGNMQRQLRRIEEALALAETKDEGQTRSPGPRQFDQRLDEAETARTLLAVACQRCLMRESPSRYCKRCQDLVKAQARELAERLAKGLLVMEDENGGSP